MSPWWTRSVMWHWTWNTTSPAGPSSRWGGAIGSASQSDQEYIVRRWDLQVSESISEFITQLTGITDEACKAGVSLEQCAQELGELLREHEVFLNPVTWGGGDSADLLRAFAQAQIEFPYFGRRWIDVKTWATLLSLARTQTAKIQHGGLSKAMARSNCASWAKHIAQMLMRSTHCDCFLAF